MVRLTVVQCSECIEVEDVVFFLCKLECHLLLFHFSEGAIGKHNSTTRRVTVIAELVYSLVGD